MVFYFTATGNSLYAARQFSEQPVSIPQVMRGTRRLFVDDSIGIVCPVYAGQPPALVLRFLKESSFQTDYFYMILTYGLDQSDSPEFTAGLLKQYGIQVDYIGTIKMVDNYLPAFDMEEEMAVDKQVEKQLAAEKKAVAERKRAIPEATEEGRALHAQVAEMNRKEPSFNNGSQIMIKENCIGCGQCTSHCPQSIAVPEIMDKLSSWPVR